MQLLATAIGAKLTGAILSAYGYVPNVEQSAASLQGILILVTIVPIIGAAIGIVVLLLYKLDEKTFKRYVKEIEERESGGHNGSSAGILDHSA